jgi:hypothetical protein
MSFFLCSLLILCIGCRLDKRARRQKFKRLMARSSSAENCPSLTTSDREPSRRTILDTFGDGVFEVGTDIAPGTYRSSGGDPSLPTIWHRLSNFTGTGIIAEGGCAGPCIVTISQSDRGFESVNSGGWIRIQQKDSRSV